MVAYIITGEEERGRDGRYIMPRNATHVSVHPSVTAIPASLFWNHPNIIELICHDDVIKIGVHAFSKCRRLKRIIIRGVRVIEDGAFWDCEELEYVECPKLERAGDAAFSHCKSLRDINLPSAKIVGRFTFEECEVLMDVKFGKELESLQDRAFWGCRSLERITIPLKNGLLTDDDDDIFQECANLRRVDLVEAAVLHDTTTAFLLEEWRNDTNAEIDSINHNLPNVYAGEYDDNYDYDGIDNPGEKAREIRDWIGRVLRKIIYYKGEHRRILNEAAATLQLALPNDIVMNNVVPFLELPLHKFDGEGEDEDEYTSEDEDREEDEEDDSHDESADTSFDEGENEEEEGQDDGGGGKRRKTADDHEESVEFCW